MPSIKSEFCIPLEELQTGSKQETPRSSVSEFRPICLKIGVLDKNGGTAYAEFGETRILCKVIGPREDSEGDFHSGRVSVSFKNYEAEFIRAQLTSALTGVIQLHKYAKSIFDVEVTVVSADGGVLQASLVASSLALINAGVEVLDVIVACHLSISPSAEEFVDPTEEESNGHSHVTVGVMPNINQIVCCDIKGALSRRQIDNATTAAVKNALYIYPSMKKAIIAHLK